MRHALLAVAVVAGVSVAAPPVKVFKLNEPIDEARIFACLESAPAIELLKAVIAGKPVEPLAQTYSTAGLCGSGGPLTVSYTKRMFHHVADDGTEYAVYEGMVGDSLKIYVPMSGWSHEFRS